MQCIVTAEITSLWGEAPVVAVPAPAADPVAGAGGRRVTGVVLMGVAAVLAAAAAAEASPPVNLINIHDTSKSVPVLIYKVLETSANALLLL